MRVLVLGGARSGKSAWAESLLGGGAGGGAPVHYVATARPWPGADGFDADFEARIAVHRSRRPACWRTVDDADAADALAELGARSPAPPTLVDDAGTWLTHQLDDGGLWDAPRGSVAARCDALAAAVAAWPSGGSHGDLVVVTPEVGLSVIPEHRSGRLFRDELGTLNARLAEVCDRVVLVVAGLPLTLKEPGAASG
ncbi:bifunctional adenosylcobinamide kinase/adenosylcobinamide-phosphate guanylyltransferase [Corynebacterium sp. 335C]